MASAATSPSPFPLLTRAAVAEALESAIGFTQESLASNRGGQLASGQTDIVLAALLQPWIRGAPAVGCWLLLWTLYATLVLRLSFAEAIGGVLFRLVQPQYLWTGPAMLTSGDRTPLILSCAALSLVLLAGFIALQTPWRALLDLLERRVECAHGRIRIYSESLEDRGMPGATRYFFELRDERRFPVSRQAAEALDDGGVYDLFFTARASLVVGIEPAIDPHSLPEPLSAHPLTAIPGLLRRAG